MKPRLAALILFFACVMTAYAFQPLEADSKPLYDCINTNDSEQKLLDRKLQAEATTASEWAASYRRFKAIEAERQKLADEVLRAKQLARSPLVTFMAPVALSRQYMCTSNGTTYGKKRQRRDKGLHSNDDEIEAEVQAAIKALRESIFPNGRLGGVTIVWAPASIPTASVVAPSYAALLQLLSHKKVKRVEELRAASPA